MRHVSQAHPASLIAAPALPGLISAPLNSTPTVLGSPSNPIVIDDFAEPNAHSDASSSISVASHLIDPMIRSNSGHLVNPHPQTSEAVADHPSPHEIFTIIPISDCPGENSMENARVCLHNLCHVAKYHGFDLQELHPDVFASEPNQSPAPLSVRDKIGPTRENQAFLDDFEMGNDVDRRDTVAVVMEEDIATLHREIEHKLRAAFLNKHAQSSSEDA